MIHRILLLIDRSLALNQLIYRNGCEHGPFCLMNFFPHTPKQKLLSCFRSMLTETIV